MIEGKDSCYKIFWVGNQKGRGSIGILLSEEWTEKVFDINRLLDRIVMIKLAIDNKIIKVSSCYAPQAGLDDIIKNTSYDQPQNTVRKVGADETLVICGDLNGHISKLASGYDAVHSGYGYSLRNKEGEHISQIRCCPKSCCWKLLFHQERQPSDHLRIWWYK